MGEGEGVGDAARQYKAVGKAVFSDALDALRRKPHHFDEPVYARDFAAAQGLGERQAWLEATLDFALLFPRADAPPRARLLALRERVGKADTAALLEGLEAELRALLAWAEADGPRLALRLAEED